MLDRNPTTRLGSASDADEIRAHPFFKDIDWRKMYNKQLATPFKPEVGKLTDTVNFDAEFTSMPVEAEIDAMSPGAEGGAVGAKSVSEGKFDGFTFVNSDPDTHAMLAASPGDTASVPVNEVAKQQAKPLIHSFASSHSSAGAPAGAGAGAGQSKPTSALSGAVAAQQSPKVAVGAAQSAGAVKPPASPGPGSRSTAPAAAATASDKDKAPAKPPTTPTPKAAATDGKDNKDAKKPGFFSSLLPGKKH